MKRALPQEERTKRVRRSPEDAIEDLLLEGKDEFDGGFAVCVCEGENLPFGRLESVAREFAAVEISVLDERLCLSFFRDEDCARCLAAKARSSKKREASKGHAVPFKDSAESVAHVSKLFAPLFGAGIVPLWDKKLLLGFSTDAMTFADLAEFREMSKRFGAREPILRCERRDAKTPCELVLRVQVV